MQAEANCYRAFQKILLESTYGKVVRIAKMQESIGH